MNIWIKFVKRNIIIAEKTINMRLEEFQIYLVL